MEKYITALYWSFTTMTTCGYGDIHPYTTNERITTMLVMLVSSGTFAFIINDIGKTLSKLNLLAV